jgi:hypothetical protein
MSDKSIEVDTFPEEWDTLLKIMPNEVMDKLNLSLMKMNRAEQISFMNTLIEESKVELKKQGLDDNFDKLA